MSEVKFKKKIETSIIDEMYQKIACINIPKMLSLRPVLIYEGEISGNIADENFFDSIINFSDLLSE
ncbi:MAG: hypothetical protein GY754_46480 [bacterium]|nr:hypothetical protein [bacterium]